MTNAIATFIRNRATGAGVSTVTVDYKDHATDTLIDSTTTDADGLAVFSEVEAGYPGPWYLTADDGTNVYAYSSKSIGQVGPWRAVDFVRFMRMMTSGVIEDLDNELACSSAAVDMNIDIASGGAIGRGLIYYWPVAREVTISASDPSNPRIDRIILRFYPAGTADEGKIVLDKLTGTPGAVPVAPTLTQSDATFWEISLAQVRVEAGVSSIAANKVTDERTFAAGPITDDSVTTDKIADLAVTTAKINDLAVTEGKIAALAVTEGKIATSAVTTNKIADNNITSAKLQTGIDATKIGGGAVSNTEYNFLNGVTSAIQTQLDDKAPTSNPTFTGTLDAVVIIADGVNTDSLSDTSAISTSITDSPQATYPAAGFGPSESIDGGALSGIISITTGTGSASGKLCRVNVSSSSTPRVVLQARSNAAAAATDQIKVTDEDLSGWTITSNGALSSSTSYIWSYIMVS